MKTAEPTDWRTEPMPENTITIDLDREFAPQEMDRIRIGLLPKQQEDKWFIYWQDNSLHFHRSWTGFCIYIVRFAVENVGCRMIGAVVNGNPEQYEASDEAREAELISHLVDVLLLRRDSQFPSGDLSIETQALANWGLVGRAMLNQHPENERDD